MDAPLNSLSELRSLAHGEPSQGRWKKLCRALDEWEDPVMLEQVALPYLMGALSRWPDDSRVAPQDWLIRQLSGEEVLPLLIARKVVLRDLWFGPGFRKLTRSAALSNCVILQIHGGDGATSLVTDLEDEESWLTRIETLRIYNVPLEDEHAIRLVTSKQLARLRELHLDYTRVGAPTLEAILSSPMATSLETLGLQQANLSGARGLFGELRNLQALKSLEFGSAELGPEHIEALADSVAPANLEALSLRGNRARDHGVRELARGRFFTNLTALDLGNNQVGSPGARALAESERASSLTKLDLQMNQIATEGALELARSPFLVNLTELKLDLNPIGPTGWRALVKSRTLDKAIIEKLTSLASEAGAL